MEDNLKNVLAFVTDVHKNQTDKQGMPYALHPIRVMERLAKNETVPVNTLIVALLHDVIEDTEYTGITIHNITDTFPNMSRPFIDALINLTRRVDESYTDYILRIKKYGDATYYGINTIAVKLADIEDNLDPNRPTLTPHARYIPSLKVKLKYKLSAAYLNDGIDQETYLDLMSYIVESM